MRRTCVLAALLAVIAGCGGKAVTQTVTQPGSAPPPTETKTTNTAATQTHAEFVAALNGFCDRGNREGDKYEAAFTAAQAADDYQKAAEVLEKTEPIYDVGNRELADLHPPAEDAPAFARYVRAYKRQEGLVPRMVQALRDGDDDTITELVDALNATRKGRLTAALDLGAGRCGK